MSVRRLLIGSDGTGFRVRQSPPGKDVFSPLLGDRLFDADFVPGRVIGSGSMEVRGNGLGWASATAPHGLGRRPDRIVAVARQVDFTSKAAVDWQSIIYIGGMPPSYSSLGSANMTGRRCASFAFATSIASGSGPGGSDLGGWQYQYDETNLTAFTVCANFYSVIVEWSALEL